jgi:hypothetical protein
VKLQSHLVAALESLVAQKQLLSESQMEMLGRLLAEAREQRAADSKRLAPGGGSGSGSPVAPRRSLLGFARKGSHAASSSGGSPRPGAAPQQRVFDLGDDE